MWQTNFHPAAARITPAAWLALGAFAILALGCSQPKPSYDMVPVTGSVQLDGKPLAEARVIFDSDESPRAFGQTDSTGQFSLNSRDHGDGVAPGSYVVRVESTDTTNLAGKSIAVPLVYSENGVEVVEITTDGPTEFTFELKSRPSRKDYISSNVLAEP